MSYRRSAKQKARRMPGSLLLRDVSRRQNETTPNSINRITMLSGTPSSHRRIGIAASSFHQSVHRSINAIGQARVPGRGAGEAHAGR
jgi:hypothetical protein